MGRSRANTSRPGARQASGTQPAASLARVVIEHVEPEIDAGRFPIKRIVGDVVTVEADVFADGHDVLRCQLLHRPVGQRLWHRTEMTPLGNDRWRGRFRVDTLGRYQYTVEAWVDRFATWRTNLVTRIAAGQDVRVERLIGANLVAACASRAEGAAADRLHEWAERLRTEHDGDPNALALDEELAVLAMAHPDLEGAVRYDHELGLLVDRQRAEFSAWYELFPRSCAPEPGRHGTFADCERWLPYVAGMGFDILYFPPIHPIGRSFRKGKNNASVAQPEDVGSPWAIGAEEGGHVSVHPDLGTVEDFRRLVASARTFGLEVALDLAYQCSPDHPYVREHPDWFLARPDGTVQYAENPPKKYEDIYPFHFECLDRQALWNELRYVILFWIEQGVQIFRVDNPHTKSFRFWEWAIDQVRAIHPEVIFLAEAFTRPRPMYRLAKLGFSQSYTYFTWRNTKEELTSYLTELTTSEVKEYFRPNLWPNTPDILHEYLQAGGRPAFMVRAVLAATLAASYGIYGPAFELCENVPREPGSEEYLHSEKYELRHRDLQAAGSLRPLLTSINRARRNNRALQRNGNLRFHDTDSPVLLCYSRVTPDLSNVIVVVVNLDAFHRQSGWVTLDLGALGIQVDESFHAHDLLTDARFLWQGSRNYVELDPAVMPAHVLRIERPGHSELDFEPYA